MLGHHPLDQTQLYQEEEECEKYLQISANYTRCYCTGSD